MTPKYYPLSVCFACATGRLNSCCFYRKRVKMFNKFGHHHMWKKNSFSPLFCSSVLSSWPFSSFAEPLFLKMKTLSYERLYAGGFEESEELSSEAFILLFSFACQTRDCLKKSQSYLILTPGQQPKQTKHYLKGQNEI